MIFYSIGLIFVNIFLALYTLIPQNTLSFGYVSNPATFLPHQTSSDAEEIISNIVFRKLFKYQNGNLANDLINTWNMSEDKTVYTMEIKNDAYWQDGEKITTDDVLYTFSLNKNLIDQIEVDKLSDTKFSITLPSANAILPTLLTFGIEPAHLGNQSKLEPVGSSDYRVARVVSESSEVKTVILQSFKKDKLYPRIIFKFYNKDEDLKTAYKLKEINSFLSNTEFDWEGSTVTSVNYYGRYFTLIFNTEKPKLTSQEARAVLEKTLDIQGLLSKNYYINAKRTFGPISTSEYTKQTFINDTYDPLAILSQAQKAELQDLDILLPNNSDGRQIEAFLRSEWESKLDIAINPIYVDATDLLGKAKAGEFDVAFIGHEVTPDPDRYSFWHSTQIKSLNLAKLQDLRADKALEEGRLDFNAESRTTHYNIFQDVMQTKVPAIFLYHPGQYLYMTKNKPIPLPDKIYNPSDIFINL